MIHLTVDVLYTLFGENYDISALQNGMFITSKREAIFQKEAVFRSFFSKSTSSTRLLSFVNRYTRRELGHKWTLKKKHKNTKKKKKKQTGETYAIIETQEKGDHQR